MVLCAKSRKHLRVLTVIMVIIIIIIIIISIITVFVNVDVIIVVKVTVQPVASFCDMSRRIRPNVTYYHARRVYADHSKSKGARVRARTRVCVCVRCDPRVTACHSARACRRVRSSRDIVTFFSSSPSESLMLHDGVILSDSNTGGCSKHRPACQTWRNAPTFGPNLPRIIDESLTA